MTNRLARIKHAKRAPNKLAYTIHSYAYSDAIASTIVSCDKHQMQYCNLLVLNACHSVVFVQKQDFQLKMIIAHDWQCMKVRMKWLYSSHSCAVVGYGPLLFYVLPNRTIQRTFEHRELSLCNNCILCRQSECFNAFLALESNEDWTVNMYFGVAVNTKSWSKNLQVVHCAIRRKCWFHCMLSSIAKYVNNCASCANKKPYYTLFLFHKPQIRQTKSHKLKLFVFLRMRVLNRSLALAHCYNIWIGEALP